MKKKDISDFKLTYEQLKDIKQFRLIMMPARVLFALAFFALIAGGPRHFFSALPGPLFVLLFGVYLVSERAFRTLSCSGPGRDERSIGWLWMAFGSAYTMALLDFYWLRPHWALLEWNWIWVVAGSGLFIVGQTIRVVSIRALGRFFTVTVRLHPEHNLIKEGIYKRIRHPAYLGLLIGMTGYVTLFASVIGYALLLFFALPAMIFRIRVEEKVLIEKFGDEYRDYCRQAKRLVPFLF
jgi:protein-S-isoprenylcysteine O-methyltransferase Ste14